MRSHGIPTTEQILPSLVRAYHALAPGLLRGRRVLADFPHPLRGSLEQTVSDGGRKREAFR